MRTLILLLISLSVQAQKVTPPAVLSAGGMTIVSDLSEVENLSFETGSLVRLTTGAQYVVSSTAVPFYPVDGIAVIETGDNQFAVLQPEGGVYRYSHFKQGSAEQSLGRALSFMKSTFGVSTLFVDIQDTIRQGLVINANEGYEHLEITSTYTGADDYDYNNAPALFIDVNDTEVSGLTITGGTGAGYIRGVNVSNLAMVALSPAKAAISLIRPFDCGIDDIFITGVDSVRNLQNGIISTGAVNQTFGDLHINHTTQNAVWLYEGTAGSTTQTICSLWAHHGNTGIKVESGTVNFGSIITEDLDTALVARGAAGNIFIDNWYLEDIPKRINQHTRAFYFERAGMVGIRNMVYNGNTPFDPQTTSFYLDYVRGFSIQDSYIQGSGIDFISTTNTGGIAIINLAEHIDPARNYLIKTAPSGSLNLSNIHNPDNLTVINLCSLFGAWGSDCYSYP